MTEKEHDKFIEALMKVCAMDDEKLEESFKNSEPHVFSERFEENMKPILEQARKNYRKAVRKAKLRKALAAMKKVAVAAAVVLVVVGGVALISTKSTEATKPGVDIVAWLKEYFSFEKGGSGKKEDEVLFTEEQIGYIPEGFELTDEVISQTYVVLKYKKSDDFIIINVDKSKSLVQSDSESVSKEINLNLAGYEYTYTYKQDDQSHRFVWSDNSGVSYSLSGTLEKKIMIQIMDSISYER